METKKLLDEAFALLCAIPVSGDSVELMAAAKEKMRNAYKSIRDEENDHG